VTQATAIDASAPAAGPLDPLLAVVRRAAEAMSHVDLRERLDMDDGSDSRLKQLASDVVALADVCKVARAYVETRDSVDLRRLEQAFRDLRGRVEVQP
jgi:hypothetical protein